MTAPTAPVQMRTAAELIRRDAKATGSKWEDFVATWLVREAEFAEAQPGIEDPLARETAEAYLDGVR